MTITNETSPDTAEAASERPWYDRAMRWAQLTLVDDDPRPGSGFEVAFWLDYFREIRADATCLSAGGYMAFYPTEVPGHRRSTQLGDTDPFGELVAGSRAMGMVVMARIDPHAVHDSIAREHPEWIAHDEHGNPRPHWSAPDLWLTCPMGPYSTELIPQVNAEIVTRYDVDAIFANRWTGTGRCYCDFCRTEFRAATGLEIPVEPKADGGAGLASDAEIAFRAWWEDRLLWIARLWDEGIRAIKPHVRYVPNSGGGSLSELDMSRLAAQTDTLFADKQARTGFVAPWSNGQRGKEFQAVMGSKPIGGIFSVGREDAPRWKDSVQSGPEIAMWAASATANGMRPWFTKFAGTISDPRWLSPVRDIFIWHADNERYLRNVAPVADVGLVYSQRTARAFGTRAADAVEGALVGWYQSLIESRTLFRLVHDRMLEPGNLTGLKVLILPNIACLSDEQCDQLRHFVRTGGSLIATHETSLLDENGHPRGDFALADLLGVHRTGPTRHRLMNSYLELHTDADDPALPLLDGIGDTTRIINAVSLVPTGATVEDGRTPLTLIDSFPDLPMEEVYRRDHSAGESQLYLRSVGRGRVLYLPGDIDRSYAEFSAADHAVLLANAVRWARASAPSVTVEASGVLEVTAWRQEHSMTVHLVNYNNAHYWKGPFTDFQPTGPVRVGIPVPADATIAGVRLLRAGVQTAATVRDGVAVVDVESVLDFEVVAIDLI